MTTTRTSTVRALGLAAVLGLAPLALSAMFHTRLTKSAPAADSTVTQAPTEVRLWFSQPVDPKLTTVTLLRSDSSTVGKVPMAATQDSLAIAGPVPGELAPGSYVVSWRTVSKDGHAVRGKYGFAYKP